MLATAPNTYVLNKDGDLLDVARSVLSRLQNLGMAYMLTQDMKYANRAWSEIQAVANFKDWSHTHFLDAGEITAGFALAYDWMYDAWTEEQKAIIREAMVNKALQYGLPNYRSLTVFANRENNQNSVVNGGLTLGALAIGDEPGYESISGKTIIGAMKSVDEYYLPLYAPAGGYFEGPVYWAYGTEYLTYMLSALDTALGSDFGLSDAPGLAETGYYPAYIEGTNGLFNYGDGGPLKITGAPMIYMAYKYEQPDLLWYYRKTRNDGGGTFGLAWYDPKKYTTPQTDYFPLDRKFAGTEVGTMRSAWYDPKTMFAGFKGGHNGHVHGDLDVGTFVLDALGVRWATDLGPEDYSIGGIGEYYPGGTRWDYYRKREEGHNTIVINPGLEPSQDVRATSTITEFVSKPQGAYSVVDMQSTYHAQADEMKRGYFMTDNRRMFIVQDEMKLKTPSDIWWFMHTEQDIELGPDGTSATLKLNDKRLWVKIISPQPAAFQVMDAKPLPTSPDPNQFPYNLERGKVQKTNEGVQKLAIHLTNTQETTLSVVMVPLSAGEPIPTELPAVKPIADWVIDERELATINGLTINGEALANFQPNTFSYTKQLPYGSTKAPAIQASSAYTVTVEQPAQIPGIAVIKVTDPAGIRKPTRYYIQYTAGLYEAEEAFISQGKIDNIHSGFTGSGFVDYNNMVGSYVEWDVNVLSEGLYKLEVQYANGGAVDRPVEVQVNGVIVESNLSLPTTTLWTNWQRTNVAALLKTGSNRIRLTATTLNGASNLDHLQLRTPSLEEHLSIAEAKGWVTDPVVKNELKVKVQKYREEAQDPAKALTRLKQINNTLKLYAGTKIDRTFAQAMTAYVTLLMKQYSVPL
ncbi:hypothetical protein SY83_03070 [Paenibacillus swuensis]|uniref:CBM6 domain-containing protein n=1 Tax=Paenibacillus swuensis TaxID=1178515 RepID=A0A172TEN7_9BACL|nr:heparinase II/III family protein [Paenibacillus swuensis]ANE45470.1 hypothetical protein SY83_03070 [Paenibacillus swuensis]